MSIDVQKQQARSGSSQGRPNILASVRCRKIRTMSEPAFAVDQANIFIRSDNPGIRNLQNVVRDLRKTLPGPLLFKTPIVLGENYQQRSDFCRANFIQSLGLLDGANHFWAQ